MVVVMVTRLSACLKRQSRDHRARVRDDIALLAEDLRRSGAIGADALALDGVAHGALPRQRLRLGVVPALALPDIAHQRAELDAFRSVGDGAVRRRGDALREVRGALRV